ncbi:TlpA family protein disulfide reductase [Bryobacter aggregatus]|uniref:TlpA family protein disulfide reductase n=1 Tax=Bryobacter aggregatus TaxID=360054 RepID=UPI0004E0C234|nr:TlpA disulfide reductase family protein [Bryobacter aggregatus]
MKRFSILLCLALTLLSQEPAREKMPPYRARGIQGEGLSNQDLAGKPALIQLWATWCGYCRRDQPILEKLSEEFKAKGLAVVAINVGESRKKVEDYLKENPRPGVKIVLNEDSNLPALIAPQGFPFYVLLDKEGRVAGVQAGSGGEESLRALLARVELKKN